MNISSSRSLGNAYSALDGTAEDAIAKKERRQKESVTEQAGAAGVASAVNGASASSSANGSGALRASQEVASASGLKATQTIQESAPTRLSAEARSRFASDMASESASQVSSLNAAGSLTRPLNTLNTSSSANASGPLEGSNNANNQSNPTRRVDEQKNRLEQQEEKRVTDQEQRAQDLQLKELESDQAAKSRDIIIETTKQNESRQNELKQIEDSAAQDSERVAIQVADQIAAQVQANNRIATVEDRAENNAQAEAAGVTGATRISDVSSEPNASNPSNASNATNTINVTNSAASNAANAVDSIAARISGVSSDRIDTETGASARSTTESQNALSGGAQNSLISNGTLRPINQNTSDDGVSFADSVGASARESLVERGALPPPASGNAVSDNPLNAGEVSASNRGVVNSNNDLRDVSSALSGNGANPLQGTQNPFVAAAETTGNTPLGGAGPQASINQGPPGEIGRGVSGNRGAFSTLNEGALGSLNGAGGLSGQVDRAGNNQIRQTRFNETQDNDTLSLNVATPNLQVSTRQIDQQTFEDLGTAGSIGDTPRTADSLRAQSAPSQVIREANGVNGTARLQEQQQVNRNLEIGREEQGPEAKTVNKQEDIKTTAPQEFRQVFSQARKLETVREGDNERQVEEPTANRQLAKEVTGRDDAVDTAIVASDNAVVRLAQENVNAYKSQADGGAAYRSGNVVNTFG